jgi:hypothetical protein
MRDGGRVNEPDLGFIAQDLQTVQQVTGFHVPGLVYDENPDRIEAGYGKLLPIYAQAIKELSDQVQELKQDLQLLKAK